MELILIKSLEWGQVHNSELLIRCIVHWCWAVFVSRASGLRTELR